MDSSVGLILGIVKLALVKKESRLLVILNGAVIIGTPITRDEYASHLMDKTIYLGEGSEPEASWFFLKSVTIQSAAQFDVSHLAVDADKVSAINIMPHQQP